MLLDQSPQCGRVEQAAVGKALAGKPARALKQEVGYYV
jgi:hypothetical protein